MKTLKIKNLSIAIIFNLFVLNPASAVITFGIPDCGQWVNSKNETRKAWLLGYMSGLSVMHELNDSKDDPLKKINSAQQIFLWMDNYCQNNPLKDVSDGGGALFIELMKKK